MHYKRSKGTYKIIVLYVRTHKNDFNQYRLVHKVTYDYVEAIALLRLPLKTELSVGTQTKTDHHQWLINENG